MHAHGIRRRALLKAGAAAGLVALVPGCDRKSEPGTAAPSGENTSPFIGGALRVDLLHSFDGTNETLTATNLRYESAWSGPTSGLAEELGWGDYRVSVYDANTQKVVFRSGFDSTVSAEAGESASRISVRFPMPSRECKVVIERRRTRTAFQRLWERAIAPSLVEIDRTPVKLPTLVDVLVENGPPAAKVDLTILAEGYKDIEYGKFLADAKRTLSYIFAVEPFKRRWTDFNVRSVFIESTDSGVTDRFRSVQKNTALRCAYGSGASERTLAPTDLRLVSEAASMAPSDFVLILANTRRYGGSSCFGGPAVAAIDSAFAPYLILHELGHAVAALAEEYYMPMPDGAKYTGNVEPWYPNVTTSDEYPKWTHLASNPNAPAGKWNKAEYDAYFGVYVRRYAALRGSGASEDAIEKFMLEASRRQAALLAKNQPLRRVAAFEGANGYAQGMYRAEVNCIMFSLQSSYFCGACSAAIERMINFHTG